MCNMGCTSSAPNIPLSLTNSEKDFTFSEERSDMTIAKAKEFIREREKELNGIQVLPTCDTLGHCTQLDRKEDRNNISLADANLDLDKDSNGNKHLDGCEYDKLDHLNTEAVENSQVEEKLSTLEEVVEKVVELYVDNTEDKTQTKSTTTEVTQVKVEEEKKDETNDNQESDKENNDDKEAEADVPTSPSQSQSSRATRWEALADIAAELPPSLAVDPITGQIYALAK